MSLIARLTKFLAPSTNATSALAPVTIQTTTPVNGNPFIAQNTSNDPDYGKNKPVPGGYFAGYYNGKPNIVGRKLFIVI